MCFGFDEASISNLDRQAYFGFLKRCSSHLAMCMVKTIVNAWTTTSRMHERVRWPCIFGCVSGRDDTAHYLSCDRLWQIVADIAGVEVPVSLLERLGLSRPCRENTVNIYVAFTTYHCLKNKFYIDINRAVNHGNFSPVIAAASEAAAAAIRHSELLRAPRR